MAVNQITGLTVEGYKSYGKKQHLQIRPLTLLAGANSSGKSSVLQPLLLLKQTLDAPFDPGPLKIDGPNVGFTRNNQLFTYSQEEKIVSSLKIGLEYDDIDILPTKTFQGTLELEFQCTQEGSIVLVKEVAGGVDFQDGQEIHNKIDFSEGEDISVQVLLENPWLAPLTAAFYSVFAEKNGLAEMPEIRFVIIQSRCFLNLERKTSGLDELNIGIDMFFNQQIGALLTNIIYVPGLRDPVPVRSYPHMPVGKHFPGPIHPYLASIIHDWGQSSNAWNALEQDLRILGMAEKVDVKKVDDTALEVMVGQHNLSFRETSLELVSLADVGLGLSQVMPVLVALRVAQPQHLVVIEQPELHLHPQCVLKLAEVIADAVNRGVRIIMETHSELLLLGIQTMVAERNLDPAKVSLNWFSLDKDGHTLIRQAEVEKDGSFGDWPVDFLDVELSAQRQYLDAVSSHE